MDIARNIIGLVFIGIRMNFISKHFTVAAILLSAICASAQDVTLADAQKAYVAGKWKEAAAAYSVACAKEPKEKQDECLLWNVLALSQTGDAKSFKEAGKRLDSLIQVVNPQQSLYADLMMTSAQFRMYLGKYDKAAEDLIHAIETSKPHQAVVLKKVCQAVKTRHHSDLLVERCQSLDNPPEQVATTQATVTQAAAPVEQAPASSSAAQPSAPEVPAAAISSAALSSAALSSAVMSSAVVSSQAASSSSVTVQAPSSVAQVTPAAPAPTPVAAPTPAVVEPPKPVSKPAAPQEEYWVLQLGAFSVKGNAEILVNNLKKRKIKSNIVEEPRGDRTLYLVQSGHFATRDAAVDFGATTFAPIKVEFQPLLKK